jgi:hypothetical protein
MFDGTLRRGLSVQLEQSPFLSIISDQQIQQTLIGDAARAQALARHLNQGFPEDTIVQFNYLPTLQAWLAITANDATRAIEILQPATPYEIGSGGCGCGSNKAAIVFWTCKISSQSVTLSKAISPPD